MLYKFQTSSWILSKLTKKEILTRQTIPTDSLLHNSLPGSHFSDSFERQQVDIEKKSALELFASQAAKTPKWVNCLLFIRNKAMASCGLLDVGLMNENIDWSKPHDSYRVGDRFSLFTIVQNTPNELVMEINDKHLREQVSFQKIPETHSLLINTVVHTHNWFGKLYMLFVSPVHALVVPTLLLHVESLQQKQQQGQQDEK